MRMNEVLNFWINHWLVILWVGMCAYGILDTYKERSFRRMQNWGTIYLIPLTTVRESSIVKP